MPSRRSPSKEGACPKSSRGPEEASSGCTRSAHPSRRLSPDETLPSRELTRASSCWSMRWGALHAGAVRSSAGRRATLCAAEEASKSNRTPSAGASGREVEGPRNISVVAKARVAASERGVPWSAARVHHARVVPLATRWAQERQMVCGSGAKSTGAVKSSAPARYWPIMKMWAAVTGTEQSALIWPSMADRVEPEACKPMAVKPLRCASTRGWPRTQMKRTAAMVSEAVRRSASWSGCGEEDGRHGLRGCSEVGELVRMRSKRRRRGAVARRVVGGFQPLGTNRSRRLASSLLRVGERLSPVTALPVGRSDLGAEGSGSSSSRSSCAPSDTIAP